MESGKKKIKTDKKKAPKDKKGALGAQTATRPCRVQLDKAQTKRRLGAYLIAKSAPRKKRNSIAEAAREPWAEISAPNAKMPCGGAANGRLPLLPMDFGFVVARGNLWIFRRIPHYDERHGLYIFGH